MPSEKLGYKAHNPLESETRDLKSILSLSPLFFWLLNVHWSPHHITNLSVALLKALYWDIIILKNKEFLIQLVLHTPQYVKTNFPIRSPNQRRKNPGPKSKVPTKAKMDSVHVPWWHYQGHLRPFFLPYKNNFSNHSRNAPNYAWYVFFIGFKYVWDHWTVGHHLVTFSSK